MTSASIRDDRSGSDAALAASLLALDPVGLGGAVVKRRFGQDAFIDFVRHMLGPDVTCLRIPIGITDDRLLGGLDLVATKANGRAIVEPGLLARSNGGLLVLPSADRVGAGTAGRIASTIDEGAVHIARDGIVTRLPAKFGLIAIDSSDGSETGCPASLKDRLAFWLPDEGADSLPPDPTFSVAEGLTLRKRIGQIEAPGPIIEVLATVALSLGIMSLRPPLLAVKAARAHAALAGRTVITTEDAAVAARLVLGPRATQIPNDDSAQSAPEPDDQPSQSSASQSAPNDSASSQTALDDDTEMVLSAVRSALPLGLLQGLADRIGRAPRAAAPAGAGDKQKSNNRGRRIGHLPGRPHSGARLDLLATIRAAAPWQRLRQHEWRFRSPRAGGKGPIIDIRPSDLRIARFENRNEAVTVFVVDASGSTALNRLAEAKGAVELLLADCYVRRDQVALIVFRRRAAELLLPPTRSLTRARRVLAELGGGGATPLASGLAAAHELVASIKSRGQTALCLLLTDGQANVDAKGATGRLPAEADALVAAAALRRVGPSMLVIDTAVRPQPFSMKLAEALAARYVRLPNANSASLSRVARQALADGPP